MMSGLSQKNFLKAGMAVTVAGLFVAGIGVKMAVAGHTAHNSKKHKMILQLNDPRWKHAMFVLGNAKNILRAWARKILIGSWWCSARLLHPTRLDIQDAFLNKHAHIGG